MPQLPRAFLTAPIAHRGLHDRAAGRIENSRAAIRAAIEAGYGIEIDLQLTVDGKAVVFHDDTLDRLTGEAGPVRARPKAELQKIALKDGGECIPGFTEILRLVAGRVPLLVEIKDQDGQMGGDVGELEFAAANAATGYRGPLAFMSFNPHSVARMGALAPEHSRGLVTSAYRPEDWPGLSPETCARLREIPDAATCGARFISHEARDLARPRVRDLHARGWPVLCWTIRSPEAEAEARRLAHNVTFEGYLPPVASRDSAVRPSSAT